MKILLVGEYSGLHNSLKKGLVQLGHDVTLISNGDGFKDYPSDYKIKAVTFNKNLIFNTFFKVFRKFQIIDIEKLEIGIRAYNILKKTKEFDIVQLININSFDTYPIVEKKIISLLDKKSAKMFLLSAGTDYYSVKFAIEKKFKYSILTPLFEKKNDQKDFKHILKFISSPYYKLNKYVYNKIQGVISSDLDYHIPLENHPMYLGMVPNPIVLNNFNSKLPEIKNKIIIFHGINSYNYIKKGNDIFEKALSIISQKYSEKIEIITSTSIPYKEYINLYNNAHIILDQVYAYDQGYNALEAMAKGKVVFTGAEKEWTEYYNLEPNKVCINAEPDAHKIADKIEWLILNPLEIKKISKNARLFIEKEHCHLKSSINYLEKWNI